MAIGHYTATAMQGVIPGLAFDGIDPLPLDQRDGQILVCPEAGALTDSPPVNILSESLTGDIGCSYFDIYYNRIWFIPSSLDFGAVAGVESQSFVVWNAYLTPQTLTTITGVNADGLTITGGTPPVVFAPLFIEEYSVEASPDGPADIDATYQFTFSGLGSFDVPVTGTRARLWPYLPNWDNNYSLTYEYKTDMFTSRSGKEQRRALRETSRKSLEYTATLRRGQLLEFNRLMTTWQTRTFVVAEETRTARTSINEAPLSSTVTVESTPDWLVDGQKVILENSTTKGDIVRQARTVDNVAANVVTFTAASGNEWPAGTKIHPALTGRLALSTQADRVTSTVANLGVRFDIEPASELPIALPAATITFDGREVFNKQPNWREGINVQHDYERDEVDFGRGRVDYYVPIEFGTRIERFAFVNRNRAQAEEMRHFFERQKGRRGEFLMPTWEDDFPRKIDSPAATDTIRIDGTEFATAYDGDTQFNMLAVVLSDGTFLYRNVLEIYEVNDIIGNDSVVKVDDFWPVELNDETVRLICWMPVWRFSSDSLTIQWVTGGTAQIQVAAQILENEPVETPS